MKKLYNIDIDIIKKITIIKWNSFNYNLIYKKKLKNNIF